MNTRGRRARLTDAVKLRIVAAAETMMMWGFPAKTAFDAVATAAWEVFKQRGMSAPIGAERVNQLHGELSHVARSGGMFFHDMPPPHYVGKWPPPRVWKWTKASRARLNPRPGVRPHQLALTLLRAPEEIGVWEISPVDGAAELVPRELAGDAPVVSPLRSTPKWEAEMDAMTPLLKVARRIRRK